MYEAYFGLHRRPFAAAPRVELYVPIAGMEAARQKTVRALQRAEGAAMVIGPAGTGKTLLCHLVAAQFRDQRKVLFLGCTRLPTRRELLQALLFEAGQPYRGLDDGELRLALVDWLRRSDAAANGTVLLVDEAHTLPLRLLEELRLLTNLADEGHRAVRMVLAGGPLLEERFASPKLEAFSQRLAARCYLEPLNQTETQQYVAGQLRAAGDATGAIIPPEAAAAVFRATGGVPRLINQVCDHALVLAFAAGCRQVSAAHIEEAWADLQQLPPPTLSPPSARTAGSMIEFGRLEDDTPEPTPDPTTDAGASPVPETPRLRIAPATCDEDPGPVGRIEFIEQSLAAVGRDFQPAAATSPEVELVFHDWGNPFEETFQDEEVVADRLVRGWRRGDGETEAVAQEASSVAPSVPHPAPLGRADQRVPSPEADAVDKPVAESPTVPLRREGLIPSELVPDSPILVVEPDAPRERPAERRPAAVVRPQQYRQLFARLRRSC